MAMSQPHSPRAGICTECARSEFIAKLAQDAARLAILDGRTTVTRRDVVTAARFYGIVVRADERHQTIVSKENIEDVPL
jgi:histone H3/H4